MSEFPECKRALWRAIEEARSREPIDRRAAEAVLHGPVIRLAEIVARRRCMALASNADTDYIQSVATQAAWEAVTRVDLSLDNRQIFQFFQQRASHAVSDAARAADPLPRRARHYRNRLFLIADQRGIARDDPRLAALARELYPDVQPHTFELMLRGAPPALDVDGEAPQVSSGADPSDAVVDIQRADAVHMAMADHADPGFRAWAARMLAGEERGRCVPREHAARARAARRALAAWAK